MMKSISTIAYTVLICHIKFDQNEWKVCTIRRYLCHDIESLCNIISWSFMSRHVICHDYCGIPIRESVQLCYGLWKMSLLSPMASFKQLSDLCWLAKNNKYTVRKRAEAMERKNSVVCDAAKHAEELSTKRNTGN